MKHLLPAAVAVVLGLSSISAVAANRSDPGFTSAVPRVGPVPAGGGSCATPVSVTSLPFSQAGNTCGGTNNVTNYGATCAEDLPFPYPGPEDVWAITVGASNAITVQASLTGSTGDLALFLLSSCGSGASCLFTSSDSIGAGAGPEALNNTAPTGSPQTPGVLTGLTPGSTYYVYVDSYYGTGSLSCGTYTLQVAGTLPVSLESYSID